MLVKLFFVERHSCRDSVVAAKTALAKSAHRGLKPLPQENLVRYTLDEELRLNLLFR